ncbi:MAG: hypothetical protein NTU98_14635 [Bacteroidetes bacterium]|nr:hypothetical protein [Bacteroidota bacterium]
MYRISASQAIREVISEIRENGLEGCGTLKMYLENEEMIHAMFIENLADPNHSYYLVYWLINKRILCIAEVDATEGKVISFTPFTHPGTEHYHNFLKAEEIVHEKFHEDEFIGSSLVWMPCRESTSSLFPFRRVVTKEHTYFVTMSGEVYSELTPVVQA